jgi:hypothetical protein
VEQQKKLEGEKLKIDFDLTKSELEYIIDNANFNDIQERVFRRLTSKEGRQSIVKISLEENLSTATVSRIIKKIKKKIYKVI